MSGSEATIYGEVIAYLRTFTDIPFTEEIAQLANAEKTFKGFDAQGKDISSLAARYEIRFKSITTIMRTYRGNQILELASGLSSRGIEFTADPQVVYVETDLPEVITRKKLIVEQILKSRYLSRPNLHFKPANVFSRDELFECAQGLRGSLMVICEGLLSLLNLSELRSVMANIHQLVNEYEGICITPDFFTFEQRRQSIASDSQSASTSPDDNRFHTFASDEELFNFIINSGFTFERYSQREAAPFISSATVLKPDPVEVHSQIENRFVYVLKAA